MSEWKEDRKYVLDALGRHEESLGSITGTLEDVHLKVTRLDERGSWGTKLFIALGGFLPALGAALYLLLK